MSNLTTIIEVIRAHPGCNTKCIAEETGLQQNKVCSFLRRLEKQMHVRHELRRCPDLQRHEGRGHRHFENIYYLDERMYGPCPEE